ncbi:MAG: hypothetical protein ACRD44_11560 [Bryobacteraceae bacterium]
MVPIVTLPLSRSYHGATVADPRKRAGPGLEFYISSLATLAWRPPAWRRERPSPTIANSSQPGSPASPSRTALFTANADGLGVAAAFALIVDSHGGRSQQLIYACGTAPRSCTPAPLRIPEGGSVFLLLFGTGIRGRASLDLMTATVGGARVPVLYAGPHGEFAGLDQVNLGPLPPILAGRGEVDIILTVEDQRANAVLARIE